MKKLLVLGVVLAFLGYYKWSSLAEMNAKAPEVEARSAVLMDAATGRIYYEANANASMPPASMSKMMTELVVLDELAGGQHKWEEKVRLSRYAAEVTGSKIGLKAGDALSVRDLFDAMVVHSANDAAIALAEHFAGTEAKFADRMNAKAKAIGLSSGTRFVNATGLMRRDLPDQAKVLTGETQMTAKDTAKLAAYLIRTYPEILKVTRINELELSQMNIRLHTTNLMLEGEKYAFSGNDGLKTGYTEEAGYCFTATSEKNGRRLISVVMGTASPDARFTESEKLLHYGFSRKDGKQGPAE
ncbi:D-alanyl-D-alanine carboxypeptidase [Paenibacillus sp. CC-CFT747]|nr:D-alanyl-D-alanine carboxypeptidase [Paenibacillus sp. CC-CFT747]